MQNDKLIHAIAGLAITLFTYLIFRIDPWVCFGIGMTAGLVKEMGWDYFRNGSVEWLDWFATIGGSLLGTIIILTGIGLDIFAIAILILFFTQIIAGLFPRINKMNTTIGVALLVGAGYMIMSDSMKIGVLMTALLFEVFLYDFLTKSIIPWVKSVINGSKDKKK